MSRHRLSHWLVPHESNNQRAKLLHPSALLVLCGLIVGVQVFISLFSSVFPQILGYASQIPPEEIIGLTNTERSNRGLPTLTHNPQLSAAAAQKAADMVAKNYWAHVSPSGTQPWAFIIDSGYTYRYAGENLARDFSDSRSVVSAWIASPSHKDNLLSNRYQDIGVAVVDGQIDGRETTLVVQLFGTPLAAAPQVSQASSLTVQAQGESTEPTPLPVTPPTTTISSVKSLTSPFALTRTFVLGLLGLVSLVLAADLLIVHYRGIVRWTSKSFAHLMFVIVITVAVSAALSGQIL